MATLITGGTGLIGSEVARLLLAKGEDRPVLFDFSPSPNRIDDKWVTISVRNEDEWQEFCKATGMTYLADDERFASLESRLQNQDALDEVINQWTSTRDRYDVTALLQVHGIPAGPVLDCSPDTYDDPHLQARDYFQVVNHPDAGTYLLSGPIFNMLSQAEKRHDPAPSLGGHNSYLLGEVLGYSEDALSSLEEKQVIGTVPLEGADMGGVRRMQRNT